MKNIYAGGISKFRAPRSRRRKEADFCGVRTISTSSPRWLRTLKLHQVISILALLLTATALSAQSPQLRAAALSSGAARLDNGSIVNIGQPFVGTFGSGAQGVNGSAGIVGVLRAVAGPAVRPQFNPSVSYGSGGFRLSVQTEPGWSYTVQASTNLVEWQSIWNSFSTGSVLSFTDPQAGNHPWRFYRVVVP